MELGEKLRLARLEAGMSQRQLAGTEITRNMLSQIENGSASPSMKTLRYLAEALGKNVSYFLEETAVVSPNQEVMASARRLYDAGEDSQAALVLEGYQAPDPIYDREKDLLLVLLYLRLARRAISEGKEPYALALLEKADIPVSYCGEALSRQRLLLLGQLPGQRTVSLLPSLDDELRLRAEDALAEGRFSRAAALLDAAEDQASPRWCLLRGQAYLGANAFSDAAQTLSKAEAAFPRTVIPLLERCYREMGDYRMAYEYACRQRQAGPGENRQDFL